MTLGTLAVPPPETTPQRGLPGAPFRTVAAGVLLSLLLFSLIPGPAGFSAVGGLVYDWQTQLRQRSLTARFDGLASAESTHFVVRFDPDLDWAWVPVVLECAEGAREAVARRLGWSPFSVARGKAAGGAAGGAVAGEGAAANEQGEEKVLILLYPDDASLDTQFGARPGFRAMGAYWCGVIQVLSPRLWLAERPPVDATRQFWNQGPLVHEYTHYLLDRLIPRGNYPRWLSEGLAQYVEYRESGYLWLDPENTITAPVAGAALYSLADLGRGFDRLENTALAYREAFLLVTYLEEVYGPGQVNLVLKGMAGGEAFETTLRRVTGLTPDELEKSWLRWLDENLTRYSVGAGEEAYPS